MIWAVIFCVCLFLLGAILGAYVGSWLGERWALEDAAGEAEAAEYIGELRPDLPVIYGRRRPRDAREDPDLTGKILSRPRRISTAAFLVPSIGGNNIPRPSKPGEIAHERVPLELVESDAAWEARVFGDLDRFMGGLLGAYPAPAGDSQP